MHWLLLELILMHLNNNKKISKLNWNSISKLLATWRSSFWNRSRTITRIWSQLNKSMKKKWPICKSNSIVKTRNLIRKSWTCKKNVMSRLVIYRISLNLSRIVINKTKKVIKFMKTKSRNFKLVVRNGKSYSTKQKLK